MLDNQQQPSSSDMLKQRAEALEVVIRELKRYLPVLEKLYDTASEWYHFTQGTGIATINGYKNAIKNAEALQSSVIPSMKWVKADTLPKKSENPNFSVDVLCWEPDSKFVYKGLYSFKRKTWLDIYGNDTDCSHWMLLPESPASSSVIPHKQDNSVEANKMVRFAEWASENYTYVEENKWDGDLDETYTTDQLYEMFMQVSGDDVTSYKEEKDLEASDNKNKASPLATLSSNEESRIEQVKKIIDEVEAMYPYKQSGNRDSYSQYNQGWVDACDILGCKILDLLNNDPNVQVSDTTGDDSNSSANNQKIISSCGQVSEQEKEWKEQFKEKFCFRYSNGIDYTDVVIDYIERYVLPSSQSQDREGLTGEQIEQMALKVFPNGTSGDSYYDYLQELRREGYCEALSSNPLPSTSNKVEETEVSEQTLTDEEGRYGELEKQVMELLGVTGQPNVLSVIEYVKTLQSK